jgi:hypothetical protein
MAPVIPCSAECGLISSSKMCEGSVTIVWLGNSGCRFLEWWLKASFVSTGSIPIGMDKYNKKIMIVTIRDPDLFRVEN